MNTKNKILTLVVCLVIVAITSYIGSSITMNETTSSWYQLIKPQITPPNYVFPVVWTVLYILIALSMYFAWINTKPSDTKQKDKIKIIFAINLVYNILWSLVFFEEKNPLAGFFCIIVVWLTTILCISTVKKSSKTSAWLLLPYLLWLTFAGVLNFLAIK
jgi:tryptophan-rich sensory protein